MNAIETTATVDEDLGHLTLGKPLPTRPSGEVRVIVLFDEPTANPATPQPRRSFHEAIGLYYKMNPDAPRLTTAEWMKELRGGEYED